MMPLEQPKLLPAGDTAARVAALERYLFRLTAQLQAALEELERRTKDEG